MAVNYAFKDPALKALALTHSSASDANYQRLEFLGDRVLGLAVAEMLYRHFPAADEGEMGRRLAALVREETLAVIAAKWDLGSQIVKDKKTPLTPGILADAVEALLGAVYLDGGWEAARELVHLHWHLLLDGADVKDAKTALQELLQGKKLPLPVYELIGTEGLEHSKLFSVRAVAGGTEAEGTGNSKKSAELAAASALLEKLHG
ncbi:MAG TPA: ribonuclease III [Alphaproteobacteria bacterium]|nr:ribonuclease III [Alphaproteobacteria bacterium]